MMKCRRRQAADPQKLKKLSTFVFSFFVDESASGSDRCGSGNRSCWKITGSTSLLKSVDVFGFPSKFEACQISYDSQGNTSAIERC